ncbi:MAG: DUF4350 domain-containing protein [Chloroflexota bacterium]
MGIRKFLVILTIALIIISSIVVWFYPSNEDFRTDNPFWNGTGNLSSIIPVSPLRSLSELPTLPPGSTLILIPYLGFTSSELEVLNGFITEGGTLILADDYGHGNQILEYLGLKARFSGQTLLDPFFNYKNKMFSRISHFVPSAVTSDINSLVFNHGTSLIDIGTADALALSSSFSFLDLNGNEERDEGEPIGPLPVIAQYNLGSGRIILTSDPSIFINSMQTMEGNYTFIQNIGAITASELLIDQSHLPGSDLRNVKNLLADVRNRLITPVGTVCLVIVTVVATLVPIWHKGKREGDSD